MALTCITSHRHKTFYSVVKNNVSKATKVFRVRHAGVAFYIQLTCGSISDNSSQNGEVGDNDNSSPRLQEVAYP